ncbi:MAG: SDR family oxidoreductase [Mucilaginibacter sp.]
MYDIPYHNEELNKFTFLITGGAGFIGSNLVEYLLKYGAGKVRVLDNLSTGFYKNIKEFENNPAFEFMEGDIRDLSACIKACDGIDYVSHQAALGSVPRSIIDPATTNDVNINGFLNMLIAVKDSGVRRMIYAASSSTYGDSQVLPKQEDIIGSPLSPYAVTKFVNELYASVFKKTYGTDTVGLRYFNVFGPKQDPFGAYAAVIPLFMKAIITGVQPVVNGDGSQTRDFTFVENAVQANIKALLIKGEPQYSIFNVAVGNKISLNELWSILTELSGSNPGVQFGPSRAGDINDSLADISRISKILNYLPAFNVKEGLALTFEWYKRNVEITAS